MFVAFLMFLTAKILYFVRKTNNLAIFAKKNKPSSYERQAFTMRKLRFHKVKVYILPSKSIYITQ